MAWRDGLTILPREMSEVEAELVSDPNAKPNLLITRASRLDRPRPEPRCTLSRRARQG
jgi:hypothetical protein